MYKYLHFKKLKYIVENRNFIININYVFLNKIFTSEYFTYKIQFGNTFSLIIHKRVNNKNQLMKWKLICIKDKCCKYLQ